MLEELSRLRGGAQSAPTHSDYTVGMDAGAWLNDNMGEAVVTADCHLSGGPRRTQQQVVLDSGKSSQAGHEVSPTLMAQRMRQMHIESREAYMPQIEEHTS